MTLVFGVMMMKNTAVTTGINYILKYIKIENCYFFITTLTAFVISFGDHKILCSKIF